VLKGALESTDYSKHIQKTRDDIATLMAVGGKLIYEERPYQCQQEDEPWMIYRVVYYEVKVGDETRRLPMFLQTVRVLIKD
jgi:hypothetical protein